MAKKLRVSNTGNVSQQVGDNASVQVSPTNQSIGVGANVGDARVGVGVNAQGQANAGVSAQTGEGNIGAGVNSAGTVGLQYQSDLGGDVQFGVGVGYNAYGGGFGVTPTVTLGDSKEANTGGQVGAAAGAAIGTAFAGPLGAAVGSFVGSAAGSLIGNQFADSANQQEKNKRDTIINRFKDAGHYGEDYKIVNPDGSTFDIAEEKTQHAWKDKGKISGEYKPDKLSTYEIDYTNDLDYVSGMAGITLSRLLNGGTNKAIDQIGNKLGNAFLGKSGYGAEFTQDTFNNTMSNARAGFAQRGIKSKEDMLALANQAFGEGRINDTDYAVAQQTAQLVFDNNFGLAQQMMGGRWDGVKTASAAPGAPQGGGGTAQKDGNRVRSPFLSGEEAQMSVQPLIDIYRNNMQAAGMGGASSGLRNTASLSSSLGLVSGAAAAYRGINQATGGSLNEYVKEGLQGVRESLGVGEDADTVPRDNDGDTSIGGYEGDYGSGIDGEISPGEYDFDVPDDLTYDSGESADYDLSF